MLLRLYHWLWSWPIAFFRYLVYRFGKTSVDYYGEHSDVPGYKGWHKHERWGTIAYITDKDELQFRW
jgi:hypothetical protein